MGTSGTLPAAESAVPGGRRLPFHGGLAAAPISTRPAFTA